MFPWFHLLIVGIIWKAFEDFWKEQLGDGEDAIREKLRSLKAGDRARLLAAGEGARGGQRGRHRHHSGPRADQASRLGHAFMRVEVVISCGDVHLTGDEPPIRVKEWRTVIGDLPINRDREAARSPGSQRAAKSKVIEGSLGFGYRA